MARCGEVEPVCGTPLVLVAEAEVVHEHVARALGAALASEVNVLACYGAHTRGVVYFIGMFVATHHAHEVK